MTGTGSEVTLYIDGRSAATLPVGVPALAAPLVLGADGAISATGFSGEMDELEISKAVRPVGFIKFAAMTQGTDKAGNWWLS